MRTIVCALDLNDSAQPLLTVAVSLARSLRAPLELLHVVHVLPPEYVAEAIVVDFQRAATTALEAYVTELRGTSGVDARSHVVLGRTYEGILERAREIDAELLVVGTHARRRAARALLGSVAERVVRGATCPVVVVPPSSAGRLTKSPPLDSGALRVLAGIDSSPASDAALAWLSGLEKRARCELRLVHLYWPPREHERLGIGPPDPFEPDPEVVAVLRRDLQARVAIHFGRDDIPLRIRPCWGPVEDPLEWEAETDEADLLVVGTSQHRGSTALATVRAAKLPIVCVPDMRPVAAPQGLAAVRTVLVTTDFSPLGNAAVKEAYRLLLRGGGDVVLFHVAEPGPFGLDPDRRREIETLLLELVPKDMDVHAIRTRTSIVADGSPAGAIVKGIRRLAPDVIVMSSHGRGGLRRAIRGSVAEEVIRTSPRPVLVVPASSDVVSDAATTQVSSREPS